MGGDPGSDPRVRELREEITSTDHEIVAAVNHRLELVRRRDALVAQRTELGVSPGYDSSTIVA